MEKNQAKKKSRRNEAPRIIRSQGIPCVVWGEDALAYYGVRIVVFELFVLVVDVDAANQCLEEAGYATEPPPEWEPLPEMMVGSKRLLQPPAPGSCQDPARPSARAIVVLLPASRWNYNLPPVGTHPDKWVSESFPFPPLPALVDCIIDVWLDSPGGLYFTSIMGCYLAYLHHYVDRVHTPSFANELHPAHRELHLRYLVQPIRGRHRLEWRHWRDAMLKGSSLQGPMPELPGLR
ncbi:MAG: hypothetical protein M4579_002800 [Chaenotheca gracillima]|nr:MAG: hypothetical protein M4579_002800 [Chaenotheca gracillima]